jgi:cytochrome c oxidase cbb3-type subunit 3
MRMKKLTALLAGLMPGFSLMAKGGGQAPDPTSATNWLELLLIFTAVVLLIVIWGLGQVLLTLNKQLVEKRKSSGITSAVLLLIGLFGLGGSLQAQDAAVAEEAVANVTNYGGLSSMEFWAIATVIGIEILVILFLAFMARRTWREITGQADAALAAAHQESKLSVWWNDLDKKFFTRAVPVEQEADVLLDHDYDGIKELDNALPPWWKWGFYITVVLAFVYIFNFHVFGTGQNPEQEYAAEMAEGRRQEEAYKARNKNLVDENNITLADADGIAAGKALYIQSCVACHAADGGGGIGPNLTDEYWLHGASMNEIYKTIKVGYPEKGMQSWQAMYNPAQMRNLASFVKTLQGTKPASPKAPQGDPVTVSPAAAPAAAADSSAKK